MKILNYLKSAKGILIRLSLIICLGFCLNYNSLSNPALDPPVILEIYFGSGGWSIELVIPDFFGISNLDSVIMTGLYDTAAFVPGIVFIPGEAFTVTQADFQDGFFINQDGDELHLVYLSEIGYYGWDYFGLKFGDQPTFPYAEVSAPIGEESIAWQLFTAPTNYSFWIVKELPNTIGLNPFQVSKRATFSGYVRDRNDAPLSGIKLDYCGFEFYHNTTPSVPEIYTDENGYFYTDNMFCKRYHFRFLYDEGMIGDTLICLEPDSANYFEFKLDTLLTGIADCKPAITSYSISNIPNPISNNTTFVIEKSGILQNQKGVLKIYSSEGYIADILPVEISGEKQEMNYNLNDKSLASGIYYYSLEIGKEKKATGKMVVSR